MEKDNISKFKNYQSDENIKRMYTNAFHKPSDNIIIKKLSGGLKNSVYLIDDMETKVVLKVSPIDESKMISVDRGILWWEARMLDKMSSIGISVPKLLYYDDSLNYCSSPYIFMTYIDGQNYLECKDDLEQSIINNIEFELGILSSKICDIKGEKYFLPSNPYKNFKNNYEFIGYLFEMLLNDAVMINLDLNKDDYNNIRNILVAFEDSLNNVSNLCLCHTDIWDGNILIKNGKVAGIVDFSDLYYCDELLTFYFHTIDGVISENFLRGFNNKKLSNDENIRIEIYRMYVILKMIVDCKLKQYGRFDWMYQNLNQRIENLTRIKSR